MEEPHSAWLDSELQMQQQPIDSFSQIPEQLFQPPYFSRSCWSKTRTELSSCCRLLFSHDCQGRSMVNQRKTKWQLVAVTAKAVTNNDLWVKDTCYLKQILAIKMRSFWKRCISHSSNDNGSQIPANCLAIDSLEERQDSQVIDWNRLQAEQSVCLMQNLSLSKHTPKEEMSFIVFLHGSSSLEMKNLVYVSKKRRLTRDSTWIMLS